MQRAWHYSYLLRTGYLVPGPTVRLRKENNVFIGGWMLFGSSYRQNLRFRWDYCHFCLSERPKENAAWTGIKIFSVFILAITLLHVDIVPIGRLQFDWSSFSVTLTSNLSNLSLFDYSSVNNCEYRSCFKKLKERKHLKKECWYVCPHVYNELFSNIYNQCE